MLTDARVASGLDHPNISSLHEILETDDALVLVLPWYDGESLRAKIARGPMRVEAAISIARQLAEVLASAHAAGILHRCLHPGSLHITADGIVKIMDFGVAELSGESAGTMSPSVAPYLAPEQLRGREVDGRTDVWAFGVILFEMLTGRLPFGGDTPAMVTGIPSASPISDGTTPWSSSEAWRPQSTQIRAADAAHVRGQDPRGHVAVRVGRVEGDLGHLVGTERRGVAQQVRELASDRHDVDRGRSSGIANPQRGLDRLLVVAVDQERDRGVREGLPVGTDREPPGEGEAVHGVGIEHLLDAHDDPHRPPALSRPPGTPSPRRTRRPPRASPRACASAAKAGIQVGAEIITWNDQPVLEALRAVNPYFGPYSAEHHRKLEQAVFLTRMPPGTRVQLSYVNPGSTEKQANLESEPEYGSLFASQPSFNKDPMIAPIEGEVLDDSGLGYIRVNTFLADYSLMARLWDHFMKTMMENQVPGLIIDLRANSGRVWLISDELCQLFL